MMATTQTESRSVPAQLPCGEIVYVEPGELGQCTGRCDGDPR